MGSQTPASYDDRQTPSFSRRSFVLGGLMGATSLFLTPLWHVGDRFAYAVESDNPEFKVFVVSSKEIGVAVVDVTDGQNKPLPGAKITLTRHSDESKTLSGTSDEDGNVVFNVESFADAVDVGEGEVVYRFDGRVDIEKDGYRRVTINRIRCDGGSGMKVPTRLTTDQNFVYLKSLSFDLRLSDLHRHASIPLNDNRRRLKALSRTFLQRQAQRFRLDYRKADVIIVLTSSVLYSNPQSNPPQFGFKLLQNHDTLNGIMI